MEYNKKKDKAPKDTILKIKEQLKKIGISNLKETFIKRIVDCNSVFALRIHFENNIYIGQNGKGTTKEYATASAYAEFVERLQGYNLFNIKQPDEKLIDKKTFLKSKTLDFFLQKENSKYYIDEIWNICNKYNINSRKIKSIPFYHFNKDNVKYLSPQLLDFCSLSTGLAAGNNKYEALVQGLFEIFERHVLVQAIINPFSFPNIPETEYMIYDSLKEYIEYANKLGFKIYVKDASLNCKYPVVCTIIVNEKNGIYKVNFGSHSILPVAIERCFTESLQGIDLSNNKHIKYFFRQLNDKKNSIVSCKIDNAYRYNYIELKNENFIESSDWEFSSEFWHKTDNYSNKDLLEYWFNKLINNNFNIFVRNMSYIDFPTYQIFIPELQSTFLLPLSNDEINIKINYYKLFSIFENNLKLKVTEIEFLDFCKYYFHLKNKITHKYKNIELYYILILFYTNNINDALLLVKAKKNNKKYRQAIKLLVFVEDYILLTTKEEKNKIIKKELSDKYGEKRTEKLINLLFSKTSFKNIIQRIKKQKTFEKEVYFDKIKDRNKKILEKNINNYFKKHKKNQEDLKNLFNTNN